MKKILQVGKFYPPCWGGIETVTINLNRLLRRSDASTEVICFTDDENFLPLDSNVESHKAFSIFRQPISFSYLRAVWKRRKIYDVFIVHYPNILALCIPLFLGKHQTSLLYWHSDIVLKNKVLGKLVFYTERFFIKKFSGVLYPTKYHIQGSIHNLSKMNCHQLLFPLAREDYCNDKVENKNSRYIVLIGRFVEYKGYPEFLRFIASADLNFQFKIIGSGPQVKKLTALVDSLNLRHRVELIVNASHDEKIEYIKGAFCLLLPSITKQEMFGMVQYEALSFGVPVITSKIKGSGTRYLIEQSEAGVLIDDIDDLPSAIEKLQDNYSTFSSNAYNFINSVIDSDYFIEQIENVFLDHKR